MGWVGSKSSAWLLVLAHRLPEVLEVSAAEVPVRAGLEAHSCGLIEGIGEEVGGVDLLDRDAVGHHVCTDDTNAWRQSQHERNIFQRESISSWTSDTQARDILKEKGNVQPVNPQSSPSRPVSSLRYAHAGTPGTLSAVGVRARATGYRRRARAVPLILL